MSRDKISEWSTTPGSNTDVGGININEGDLLIFLAYLPHKVKENESSESRIVISFNIDIKN